MSFLMAIFLFGFGCVVGFTVAAFCVVKRDEDACKIGLLKINGKIFKLTPFDF